MDERTIDVQEIFDVLRRHLLDAILIIALCLEVAAVAAIYLPKKFKAKATLSIQSAYFRNPLVSDLVTEITDPAELSAQRQSLLRLALSDQFLDSLGERYSVFKSQADSSERAGEREGLLKRIEYISMSPTTFQISVVGTRPKIVFDMTKDVLDQMTFTLIEERYQTIVKARDAIKTQVEFLSRALNEMDNPGQSQYLQSELDKINASIASLRTKFTESHPELYKLRQKAQVLENRIKNAPPPDPALARDDMAKAFVIPSSKAPVQDIFNDLLKKLSHLNIVLEMEKDRANVSYLAVIEKPTIPAKPFSPRTDFTLLAGLGAGVMIALLQILFSELKTRSQLSSETAAELLEIPLLGELPVLESWNQVQLLEGPIAEDPMRLPFAGNA